MSSISPETINNILSDEREVREATAPYQAEFPYERDDEAQVTRREFCNFLFLTSGALLLSTGGFAAKAVSKSVMSVLPSGLFPTGPAAPCPAGRSLLQDPSSGRPSGNARPDRRAR